MTTAPSPTASEVQVLAGICERRGGYSDSDVNSDLSVLSRWTGLQIVCLWSFMDGVGVGGDSDYAVFVPGTDGLFEAPPEIGRFLLEGDLSPMALKGIKPGAYMEGSESFLPSDPHNWYIEER